jgi:hypothetical protein
MKSICNVISAILVVAAAGALGACEGLPGQLPGPKAAELPADGGLILFSADTVGDSASRRVQYADNEQRVEYTLYKGNGAQAEFVYMETPYGMWVSLEYPYTIRDKVETWKFSHGQPTEWGTVVHLRTALGLVFYKPYRLTGRNLSCFGMSGEWDTAYQDPQLRPERIMFGYYCAPPGKALSEREILNLVDRIGLKGTTVRSTNYAARIGKFYSDIEANFGGRSKSARAVEIAQGNKTPDPAGIPGFPFNYTRYYDPGGGNDLTN